MPQLKGSRDGKACSSLMRSEKRARWILGYIGFPKSLTRFPETTSLPAAETKRGATFKPSSHSPWRADSRKSASIGRKYRRRRMSHLQMEHPVECRLRAGGCQSTSTIPVTYPGNTWKCRCRTKILNRARLPDRRFMRRHFDLCVSNHARQGSDSMPRGHNLSTRGACPLPPSWYSTFSRACLRYNVVTNT